VEKGYLSQETIDVDGDRKVIELFDITSREEGGRIRTVLVNMGFDEKMINNTLSSLSLGELTRVRMTKLIIKNQDLLILDEPLNHLDIYSREKLEEALLDYNGTILVVSHDRYMLQNLCDVLLVFKDNKIVRVSGTAKEYLENIEDKKQNKVKENKIDVEAKRNIEEERLIIENEIAFVLGEFSKLPPGSKEYEDLDKRFKNLIERRKLCGIS
jgi:macrolide transport system ATP-binding/permease protein